MTLAEAVRAYFAHRLAGPELDAWDTEDGMPAEGAQRFASDWAWHDWHKEQRRLEDVMRELSKEPNASTR